MIPLLNDTTAYNNHTKSSSGHHLVGCSNTTNVWGHQYHPCWIINGRSDLYSASIYKNKQNEDRRANDRQEISNLIRHSSLCRLNVSSALSLRRRYMTQNLVTHTRTPGRAREHFKCMFKCLQLCTSYAAYALQASVDTGSVTMAS